MVFNQEAKMERFRLALQAELRQISEEIEVLRWKARSWMVRAENYRQDGDVARASSAAVIATAFSQVADNRQDSIMARIG